MAHLSLTAAAVLPLVEAAIRDLREKRRHTDWPSRMDLTGWAIARSLEPRWMRTKTLARFVPVHLGPTEEILPRFLDHQDQIRAALDSAEGLDLGAAKITSPFNEKIRYNLLSAFRILETHERRHLKQAEAALSPAA